MDDFSLFRRTLHGVQSGSETSFRRLVEDYEPHVRRAVRRRLPRRLRTKYDSDDFIQMVWASMFRNRQRVCELAQPIDLVRFLTILARNKLVEELRKRLWTQGYNVSREQSLWADSPVYVSEGRPSPSQQAIAQELWRQLMEQLPERDRQLVLQRMQGASFAELARQFQLHERTIRKIFRGLSW